MAQPIAEFTVVEVIIISVLVLAETSSRGSVRAIGNHFKNVEDVSVACLN